MRDFYYQNNTLLCEQVPLQQIAKEYGTPMYVYSRAALTRHYLEYRDALGSHDGMVCYAVKANSNLAVLNVLARLGAGFDIVSVGELERVMLAGGDPSRVVFSGVAKKHEEIQRALEAGVFCFNIESISELERLNTAAKFMGIRAAASLRVNPDVDPQTHPYISTGLKENKFGIDIEQVLEVHQYASSLSHLDLVGIDCHIGSQLTTLAPFINALDRLLNLLDQLLKHDIIVRHLNLGGGLGVVYDDEHPPSISELIEAVKIRITGRNLSLLFEPGRSIAANAGVLLTKVEFLKSTKHKNFAIIDAGMNDNIRPSLYQAWQNVLPLKKTNTLSKVKWDLVGPVCETGDFLAKNRSLVLAEGDYLALMSAGAYGFSMSSNYNSRTRPVEMMVDKNQIYCIRTRETLKDLVRGETLLP